MRKNLIPYKVRRLKGNPNKIKNSSNPIINQIYHYYGDIDSNGKVEEAYINSFKDHAVSFTSAFYPIISTR